MKGTTRYKSNGEILYFLNGEEVSREEYEAAFPSRFKDLQTDGVQRGFHTASCWPMASEAMAVSPKDIEKAMAQDKLHGVRTDYNGLGQPIYESREHRKQHLKLHGFHDNRGGYGDG